MGKHVNKRMNTQVHSEETRAKIGVASKERATTKLPCKYGCGLEGNSPTLGKHYKSVHTFVCIVPNCSNGPHKARGFCLHHWQIDVSLKPFGMTIFDYYELYEKQNGLCAICKMPGVRKREQIGLGDSARAKEVLVVDHNHLVPTELSYRGLLCNNCNLGLGHFKDNPQLLINAVDYLRSFE